jgi:ribosomal-protein-alanine N-acetyltransferase
MAQLSIEMELRPFRPSDLQTLYEIDQACFPPEISYSLSELEAFVTHPGSMTWTAEDGGEITGFLVAQSEADRIGHIITIDVVEAWRRCGVGRALMDAAERWATEQHLRMIYLETAEDNLAAQRFYKKYGYAKVEKLEEYYPHGGAAWIMVKWMK